MWFIPVVLALCGVIAVGCANQPQRSTASPVAGAGDTPEKEIKTIGGIALGEPLAVTLDFDGNPIVANGVPGSIVHLILPLDHAVEFQQPPSGLAFYPADIKPSGFFVYVVDPVQRLVLRFYRTGSYLDVLINFDEMFGERRVAPVGLDVDGSGRMALTDVKNHTILIFDTYLDVELVFGTYGTFAGQFDSPEGVFFTPDGGLLVADSGNRRVQAFDADGGFIRMVPSDSTSSPLRRPRRAVMDPKGRIYVADPEAGRVFVFDENGRLVREVVPRGAKEFRPTDVAVSPTGLFYVTDTANHSLYAFR